MGRIHEKYKMQLTPAANPGAVVKGDNWRFTILTPCLIRAEYSVSGEFEDHATQVVINRSFPVPDYMVVPSGDGVIIRTKEMEIRYKGGAFAATTLSVKMSRMRREWFWGQEQDGEVMPGTTRTLDRVDGACELEKSILCRKGVAVMDDSESLTLAEDGWIDPRAAAETDAYLFAYLEDYLGALRDYCTLTGRIPLLPRFAFGNWWSRYYRYTQEEYLKLMDRFEAEEIPFSVGVIDMDWHKVKIDPKYGTGWTGWTWDPELFPDHKALLTNLRDRGMEVTLNLHPAEGFSAHEDCYPEMARLSGVDPATEQNIPFDVTDPKCLENYFEAVLHPMEKEGVSFWWMDWQQGKTTSIPGLDPLWAVNHFHYQDMQDSGRRPMIFSRYAGHGSQRYPIGFSGDTHMTWASLDFQPYFTNMASNVDYSWWSHDIGGHMLGVRDDEMATRWVQLGVFSPINRLHSTQNEFMSKEPWNYNRDAEAVMKKFLRLRHRLIPYLYTMNERTASTSIPLVCPMYFMEPDNEWAYRQPNEYYFGSELLVSPITAKADAESLRGRVKTYLPKGLWFDVFTGMAYDGDRKIVNSRSMESMPVFAKAGAILPLDDDQLSAYTNNPKKLRLEVFPGADNTFDLYEDDGRTNAYQKNDFVTTAFTWCWSEESAELRIAAPCGNTGLIPDGRTYTVAFRCTEAEEVTANMPCVVSREKDAILVELQPSAEDIVVTLKKPQIRRNDVEPAIFDILLAAQWSNTDKARVMNLVRGGYPLPVVLSTLNTMNIPFGILDAITEILMARVV